VYVSVEIRGGPSWKLRGEQLRAAMRRGLRSAAERGRAIVQRSGRQVGAVDTGEYVRAWHAAATLTGAVLFNSSRYAPVIEHGRRPGTMPPIAPLTLWVLRKLKGQIRSGARYRGWEQSFLHRQAKRRGSAWVPSSAKQNLYAEAQAVAIRIAFAIKAHGTKARHPVANVFKELKRIALVEAQHEIRVALANNRKGRP
jgi:hypothetical protein